MNIAMIGTGAWVIFMGGYIAYYKLVNKNINEGDPRRRNVANELKKIKKYQQAIDINNSNGKNKLF